MAYEDSIEELARRGATLRNAAPTDYSTLAGRSTGAALRGAPPTDYSTLADRAAAGAAAGTPAGDAGATLRSYQPDTSELSRRLNTGSALRGYSPDMSEVQARLGGSPAPASIAEVARQPAQSAAGPSIRTYSAPPGLPAPEAGVPSTIADAAGSAARPASGSSVIGRMPAQNMGMADVVQPRAIAAEAPAAAAGAEQAAAKTGLRAIGSRLLGPAVAAAVEGMDVVKVARDPNSTAGDVAQQALESGAKVLGAGAGAAALSPIPVVGPVAGSVAGYKVAQEGITATKQGVNELRAMFNLPPMDARSPVDRIAAQGPSAVGQANAAPAGPADDVQPVGPQAPQAGSGRGFVNPQAAQPDAARQGAGTQAAPATRASGAAAAPAQAAPYVLGENAVEVYRPGGVRTVAVFGANGPQGEVPGDVFDAGRTSEYLASTAAAGVKAADPLAAKTAAEVEVQNAKNKGALDVATLEAGGKRIPAGYERQPDGSIAPMKGGPADIGKALPHGAVKELGAAGNSVENTQRLASSFKNEFGGHTILGDMSNTYGRIFGDKTGQAQWWQDMDTMQNQTRHELFGSALTNTELGAWEKTSITPKMDPQQIRENLTRRSEIEARAASKLARSYSAAGYNKDQINELLGSAAQYISRAAPLVKPVGAGGSQPTQKSIGGKTYENDGKGWYEVAN